MIGTWLSTHGLIGTAFFLFGVVVGTTFGLLLGCVMAASVRGSRPTAPDANVGRVKAW